MRDVLERLGEPEEIVSGQYGTRARPTGIGAQALTAIVLLLVGGFLFGVGWLVGVVLLWTSRAWTTGEKLIGTLVIPGGLFGSLFLASSLFLTAGETCVTRGGQHGLLSNGVCDTGSGTIVVGNKDNFERALSDGKYEDFFRDRFRGTWGHCTARGNALIAENLAGAYVSPSFADAITFIVIIAVLTIRPEGIFGRVRIRKA